MSSNIDDGDRVVNSKIPPEQRPPIYMGAMYTAAQAQWTMNRSADTWKVYESEGLIACNGSPTFDEEKGKLFRGDDIIEFFMNRTKKG